MEKILLKRRMAKLLSLLGIWQLKIKMSAKNSYAILMYHRIYLPKKTESYIEPGMFVSPETFEQHLQLLNKHFKVVPLKSIFNKDWPVENKPVCALTFDDAWSDFYFYAFPLLKKYNTSATLFVPTDFIGTDKWFWTDRLAYLISTIYRKKYKTGKRELKTGLAKKIANSKGPSIPFVIEDAISLLKKENKTHIEEAIADLEYAYGLGNRLVEPAFINWPQLGELARSELITIGSHTDHHLILTNCNEEEIYLELQESRKRLVAHKVVEDDFIPFCYPNGNFDIKIAKMVAESGYDMAVTTKNGWNHFCADQFSLKRIGLHEDISSTSGMLGCRLAGVF